ncbi:MAG: alpha/beta hydrolase family esterase [bacterium]
MSWSRPLIGSVVACLLLQSMSSVATTSGLRRVESGEYEGTLELNGTNRTYVLHAYPGLPAAKAGVKPRALVIVLHGGGGNAKGTAEMTGFNTKADKEGFIALYPQGTSRLFKDRLLTWNSGNCCGFALDSNADDVGFIGALIDYLIQRYAIDKRRIYATGISNGGMMAYRLGCELSDKIAAIAPVAGALNLDCKPNQPVSVVAFHGTADLHVLYDGGVPKRRADKNHPRTDKSVADSIDFWVKFDGCLPKPQSETRGNIMKDTYTGCKNETSVALYSIKGQGHAWPGGHKWAPWADLPTTELSATDVTWEFFKAHPKPPF